MFALCATRFKYNVEEFEQLTPAELNEMFTVHQQEETQFYEFLLSEFRGINFFTIKSSMGDTKRIPTPKSLYLLPSEMKEAEKQKSLFEKNQGVEMLEGDIEALKRLSLMFDK